MKRLGRSAWDSPAGGVADWPLQAGNTRENGSENRRGTIAKGLVANHVCEFEGFSFPVLEVSQRDCERQAGQEKALTPRGALRPKRWLNVLEKKSQVTLSI
jgi:hypothetical protein